MFYSKLQSGSLLKSVGYSLLSIKIVNFHRMKSETQSTSLAIKEGFLKLENKISGSAAELKKWMFIFFISQVAALSSILFAIVKLYFKK
jgi:hypothetical protein